MLNSDNYSFDDDYTELFSPFTSLHIPSFKAAFRLLSAQPVADFGQSFPQRI